jgi:protein involved in polysaccharide export with SLBB domain
MLCLSFVALWPCSVSAQERTGYLVGEPQGLEMMVHIIGEVQKPGEYRVHDQTNLLELVSKAGGPTQFSRLSSVTVRRTAGGLLAGGSTPQVEILHVDLAGALHGGRGGVMPVLKPDDVVLVPTNSWHTWKDISAILRDLSVVATAYFYYLRVTD